jgi:hypothetical protein
MGFLFTALGLFIGYFLLKGKLTSSPSAALPPTPVLPPTQPVQIVGNPWPEPLSDYEVLFQKAVKDAGGTQNMPYRAVFIQSHLETAGGTSRVLRDWHNGFGFHGDVGAPNKFWDGSHQTTEAGEVMRIYKSLDLSIGDYLRLIQARYPECVLAAHTGDIKGYFRGLVNGGYATDPNYYNDLLSRYKSVYGVNA